MRTTRIVAAPVDRARRPTPEEFVARFARPRRPVVLTGMMDDWQALARWTPDHLRRVLGDAPVRLARPTRGVFSDLERGGLDQRLMRFRDCASVVLSEDPGPERLGYLMNHELAGPFAPLLEDVRRPYLIPDRVVARRRTWTHLWIGPGGTITPAHYDAANNLFGQVRGRKKVILVSPAYYDRLYPLGIDAAMPHNSRIGDIEHVAEGRFPRFRDVPAQEVDLGPGEMLYIPPFWWHQVRSLSAAVSVNFWWQPPVRYFATRPGLHVLAAEALRQARGLAAAVRAARRGARATEGTTC